MCVCCTTKTAENNKDDERWHRALALQHIPCYSLYVVDDGGKQQQHSNNNIYVFVEDLFVAQNKITVCDLFSIYIILIHFVSWASFGFLKFTFWTSCLSGQSGNEKQQASKIVNDKTNNILKEKRNATAIICAMGSVFLPP